MNFFTTHDFPACKRCGNLLIPTGKQLRCVNCGKKVKR